MSQRVPVLPSTCVAYLRVSTARQATEGVGLDAQEDGCRRHAARMGWPVTAVYRDEGISGRDDVSGRPGLASALEAVRATSGTVLVVYSVSRLARRQSLLCRILADGEIPLASATEPFETASPMGRAMLGMLGVFAQLESDMTSERTRDALAAARARGVRLGAPDMVRLGAGESVRRAHELRAEGLSLVAIADRLNAEGVPTAKPGAKWWPRTVRVALALDAPAAQDGGHG